MKKIFTYLSIVLFCGALVGCEKQLDIAQHGNVGPVEEFYQTDDDALHAAASMYIGVSSLHTNWFLLNNALSDDSYAGGAQRGDYADMEYLNEYNFSADNSYIQSVYTNLYAAIYRANCVLDALADDTEVKRQVLAEGRVLRAWEHMQLVALFGAIPIVDHVLGQSEYRPSPGVVSETWEWIENELIEAINSGWLPSKTDKDDHDTTCRITKEVAQGFLGKAYIYQEKYAEAAAMLDNVINSGLYALYDGDYEDILHAPFDNCCESFFEVQKRNNLSLADYVYSTMWAYYGMKVTKLDMDEIVRDYFASSQGSGFGYPQKGLYEAFLEWEGADGYRFNKVIKTMDYLAHDVEYPITISPGEQLYGCEGYIFWKYRCLASDQIVTGVTGSQFTNAPIMRYAEVILLAAEAHLLNGNQSKALEYINLIRDRARETPLSSVTFDDIKTEKRLELCMEAVRFQDLIRWGDAENALKNQGQYIYHTKYENDEVIVEVDFTNTQYGFKTKNWLLPVPTKEIDVNPNARQNDGW